ncbi:hypothetical protein ACN4EE_08440 [Geminocystis sp. CENA526]
MSLRGNEAIPFKLDRTASSSVIARHEAISNSIESYPSLQGYKAISKNQIYSRYFLVNLLKALTFCLSLSKYFFSNP